SDGGVMLVLADWAQRIATFRPEAAGLVGLAWPYKVHMVLGMTIFLLFPFSRLVHVWSGLASVAYLFRPYQIVRSRRLNVPRSPAEPRPRAGA
ncbi:MAG: respiratory nitrate reductase subunit gamma, partial [Rubrivivax sp.]|nr:respiratory nitrate reductase subunit gamma [Rubrivivax sp.]